MCGQLIVISFSCSALLVGKKQCGCSTVCAACVSDMCVFSLCVDSLACGIEVSVALLIVSGFHLDTLTAAVLGSWSNIRQQQYFFPYPRAVSST